MRLWVDTKTMSTFIKAPEEIELSNYIDEMDAQLETLNARLVYGDGIYVGVNILREFYKGKHWSYRKEGGGAMRTFNYCYTVIENMTAFLANEAPETHSQPRDTSDPVERVRSEGIDQLLGEVHRINKFPLMFQKGARCGSLNGVTFIFGAIWDEQAKMIRYWNIENVENIRPIWKDSNFNELEGFINRYYINPATFRKRFKTQIEERGIDMNDVKPFKVAVRKVPAIGDKPSWTRSSNLGMNMYEVQEYYDDTYYMTRVIGEGGRCMVVDFFAHNSGFVPGIWIPNVHIPGEPNGTSDIENLLDAQVAYNESKSNEEDIIRQVAFTSLWGKNLDNYSVIETGVGALYNFNDEADLQAIPRSNNPLVLEQYQRDIQGDIINLSGQNQALYPGGAKSVLASTGRALSVLMQGINNKVSLRKNFWKDALETLNRSILILAEKKIDNAKLLIDGNYRTDVFISSVLLRDVTEEINKFNAKLQSMTTTQKNLGIPSPTEEQKLMKEELKDPIFGVEIARQPGLLQQILAAAMQQEMQSANAAGGGSEQNPELAIMEEEGSGASPIAAPQQRGASKQSPAGAVSASGQRATGASVAKGKK